jgi:hypothetical protein
MKASRLEEIRAVYESKREFHPELNEPLTWNGVRAVLRRESIELVMVPMVKEAALISAGGAAVILLNSELPPRRHTYRVAHELGHAWLHADSVLGDENEHRWSYHMESECTPDPREDEAEAMALLLLRGPLDERGVPRVRWLTDAECAALGISLDSLY